MKTHGLVLGTDTKVTLVAAGLIFVAALLLGVWKYRQMSTSSDGSAHPYVDIAHRAALMYSFATLLLAVFVELSVWPTGVDLVAAIVVIVFFVGAIGSYVWHGHRRDTDNQFVHPARALKPAMTALIVGEVGGFLVVFAGFIKGQFV